jgi:hypothetical protein
MFFCSCDVSDCDITLTFNIFNLEMSDGLDHKKEKKSLKRRL